MGCYTIITLPDIIPVYTTLQCFLIIPLHAKARDAWEEEETSFINEKPHN